MKSYRASRFLINRIDERLGDMEKEKKFDILMIFAGLALISTGVLLLCFCLTKSAWTILCFFMIIAGLSISYVMIKEYIDDCKKATRQNQTK